MGSRDYLDTSEVAFALQALLPSWCWTFGSQNEHKAGQLETRKATIVSQKRARNRFRLGFAGYDVRSRTYLEANDVLFRLQVLLPSWCWTFGGQNGLETGQLEARKATILDQKSARIWSRLGFAGYEVRGRTHLDASEVLFGLQVLLPS